MFFLETLENKHFKRLVIGAWTTVGIGSIVYVTMSLYLFVAEHSAKVASTMAVMAALVVVLYLVGVMVQTFVDTFL